MFTGRLNRILGWYESISRGKKMRFTAPRKIVRALLATGALAGSAAGVLLGTAGPALANCDLPRLVFVQDARMYEGSGGGPTVFVFSVTTANGCAAGSVTYGTVDGNASAAAGDYTAIPPTTLSWAAGDTSAKAIVVMVERDNIDEANETFSVKATGSIGFVDTSSVGLGTILDDDGAPSWNVDDVHCPELTPPSGVHPCTITITLSTQAPANASVNVSTQGGTATPGVDYVSIPAPGKKVTMMQGGTMVQTLVDIKPDSACELSESFNLVLSAPSAGVLADSAATVMIDEDDIFCDI
jgi:hypothetical protein